MKRESVVWKLFLLTVGLFTITFLFFFLGQSLFLEKFYIQKKTDRVQQAFKEFVTDYEHSRKDFTTVKQLKQRFYEQTNAQLLLLDRNGIVQDEDYYYMEIKELNTNKTFYIPLNTILNGEAYSSFMNLSLQERDHVFIKGILKDNVIIPVTIQTKNQKWRSDSVIEDLKAFGIQWDVIKDELDSHQFMIDTEGYITKLHLPLKADLHFISNVDSLMQAVQSWELAVRLGEADQRKLTTYSFQENEEVRNQVFVKPIMQNGKIQAFAFAMTSLQPVDEAMNVLKHYYLYAFIFVFFIIILLSFYFSKMIARPLLEIHNVTKKMANLDFSQKLPVISHDEIGSLSKSINTLSVNLKDRIEKLRITNEQLKEEVKKERQLERTRKEFISGISHELKTPLSVIRSFAEGIKDKISSDTDYYTDVILEEVDNMNTLILEMLELAKLESGTYKLKMTPFSIGDLLSQVHAKLSFNIENKHLHVQLEADRTLIVQANRNKIEQVVVNLLSNAIRHTPTGQCITLGAYDYGSEVKVIIHNTGEPIPEDSLERIWDRFYRIDASRSRHTGGTGLGLSITKHILELHKAPFGVQNSEDGVTFYFQLQKPEHGS